MKKIFLFVAALGCTIASVAADYQKSVGLLVGNLTGFSYKHFITENLAIQSDLSAGVLATAAGIGATVYMDGMSASAFESFPGSLSIYDFGINENVLYQRVIKNSNFSYILGGGISIGFASPYKLTYQGYSNWLLEGTESGNPEPMFKCGVNGYIGAEYKMPNAPITFGADFRPGYGLLVASHYSDGDLSESVQYHYFDWHLAVSMRYCF